MTIRDPQKVAEPPVLEKKGHGAKSSAVRERAILALLSERTIDLAAKKAGVHERTLRKWLSEDLAFQAEYRAARHATYEAAINRIHGLTARAVETLEDLMNGQTHPNVRLGAARTVAEIGMHRHDAETIIERLDAIEARHQGKR